MRAAMMMRVCVCVAGLASGAHAQLMIPDRAGDRVMLFSEADGSVIDLNWITDVGAVGWAFSTPREARVVAGMIWVSDQVEDAIHRFDMDRNYVDSIRSHFVSGAVLDNLRGMGVDDSGVYVTTAHGNAAYRGIVKYDFNGVAGGYLPGPGSYFDAEPHVAGGGALLVSSSTSNAIERWVNGSYAGMFSTLPVAPQQIAVQPDGSVITVSSIASPTVEGIYHFNVDGSLRLFVPTEGLKAPFGEQVPHGACMLGDGSYLVTTDAGVFKTTGTPPSGFIELASGVDAQYVVALPPPAWKCACDWNDDGALNSQDFFDYLSAFFASAADFNTDGATNSQDFFDFMSCFFAGCE